MDYIDKWHFRPRADYRNTVSPAIRGGYVPSPPANLENPRIIDAVLKRLCMILYTLKYASKTHSKDSVSHKYSNNVAIIN